jgi:hypothetical protein
MNFPLTLGLPCRQARRDVSGIEPVTEHPWPTPDTPARRRNIRINALTVPVGSAAFAYA